MAIKILTVSDVVEPDLADRFSHPAGPRPDLILACGDLPPEYLTSLTARLRAPLCYVRGNHDIRYTETPPQACLDIHRRLVHFRGLRLLGLGGSRWYNGGPNQYHEKEMLRMVRCLRLRLWWRTRLDIVVTHAPPRYVGDAEDPCHRGFASFHRLIANYAPRFFVHGHIHAIFNDPSERVSIVKQTRVINSYGHFFFEIDPPAPER